MPITQCLRSAQFLPTSDAEVGYGVQVTAVAPLRTRWNDTAGGGTIFPVPTAEGDVIQADAALQWIAVPIDGGSL